MKTVLKKANNYLGEYIGVKLKKTKKVPTQITNANHPIEGEYLSESFPFAMKLPLVKGRIARWFCASSDSMSPLVLAAKILIEDQNDSAAVKKIFMKYVTSIDVHNSNEYLGLTREYKVYPDNVDSSYWSYPWSNISPNEMHVRRRNVLLNENRKFGLETDENLIKENCSERKIEIEYERIRQVLLSIITNGYDYKKYGCINCMLLIHGDDYRWITLGGNHRVAVLAALEKEYAEIKINYIVRREDAKYWPNVKSGLYNKKTALKLFDNFFEARIPQVFNNWVNYVKKEKL